MGFWTFWKDPNTLPRKSHTLEEEYTAVKWREFFFYFIKIHVYLTVILVFFDSLYNDCLMYFKHHSDWQRGNVDLITYTIDRIGLKGQIMCRARGYAPWGLEVSSDFHIPFYLVEAGGGWLLIDNISPIRLNQGDLIFLHGAPVGCSQCFPLS